MKVASVFVIAVTFLGVALLPPSAFGQSFTRFGAGAKASTLGIGIEGATDVTRRSNVRFGVNFYDYDKRLDKDGVNYDARLNLSSLQLTYDQYIIGGLHVSPGLLLHNRNRIEATASVPVGKTFSLGGTPYYSSASSPINGAANATLGKSAPMLMLGFGNLLPRSGRHFGVNFEFGAVFQGSPEATLNLTGTACTVSATAGCVNAGADPVVQNNVRSEQNKLNDDLKPFKYYPVVSFGISWQFKGPSRETHR